MSQSAIPRFLLRRHLTLRPISLRRRPTTTAISLNHTRHASSRAPQNDKSRILEKPSKFNPPSHGARLPKSKPRNYPGPALSPEAKEDRATKKYPNLMPAEGSFMYWFLTNRFIHMWITLSTLFSLALFTFLTDFRLNSPFAHLLPPFSSFASHPIDFIRTWLEVYKLHTARISAETAERRKRKVDDVVKRGEYRKAHGLDRNEGFGGWTAKREEEAMGPALKGSDVGKGDGVVKADSKSGGEEVEIKEKEEEDGKGGHRDFERRKRPVKMWLGIW